MNQPARVRQPDHYNSQHSPGALREQVDTCGLKTPFDTGRVSKMGYLAPHHSPPNIIEGVTVCVNYADFLDEALHKNLHHFNEFVVVTHFDDRHTKAVCDRHGVQCIVTDVMLERGDEFNKGLAINLGLAHLRHNGWLCHLDSDIVLPDNFRNVLHKSGLNDGCIYGADRMNVVGFDEWERVRNSPESARQFHHRCLVNPTTKLEVGARLLHNEFGYCPIGYFQLWHSRQQKRYPINQGSAEHTDVLFSVQWPREHRRLLPTFYVYHLESEPAQWGANWGGRRTKPFAKGR